MTKINAGAVEAAVIACLFQDHEIDRDAVMAGTLPETGIVVEGIISKYLLNITKVEAYRDQVLTWIRALDPKFHKGAGGGFTFLNLPFEADGTQWGEQRNAELLYVLANALGLAYYCLPRKMWGSFPGGMPYIQFDPGTT